MFSGGYFFWKGAAQRPQELEEGTLGKVDEKGKLEELEEDIDSNKERPAGMEGSGQGPQQRETFLLAEVDLNVPHERDQGFGKKLDSNAVETPVLRAGDSGPAAAQSVVDNDSTRFLACDNGEHLPAEDPDCISSSSVAIIIRRESNEQLRESQPQPGAPAKDDERLEKVGLEQGACGGDRANRHPEETWSREGVLPQDKYYQLPGQLLVDGQSSREARDGHSDQSAGALRKWDECLIVIEPEPSSKGAGEGPMPMATRGRATEGAVADPLACNPVVDTVSSEHLSTSPMGSIPVPRADSLTAGMANGIGRLKEENILEGDSPIKLTSQLCGRERETGAELVDASAPVSAVEKLPHASLAVEVPAEADEAVEEDERRDSLHSPSDESDTIAAAVIEAWLDDTASSRGGARTPPPADQADQRTDQVASGESQDLLIETSTVDAVSEAGFSVIAEDEHIPARFVAASDSSKEIRPSQTCPEPISEASPKLEQPETLSDSALTEPTLLRHGKTEDIHEASQMRFMGMSRTNERPASVSPTEKTSAMAESEAMPERNSDTDTFQPASSQLTVPDVSTGETDTDKSKPIPASELSPQEEPKLSQSPEMTQQPERAFRRSADTLGRSVSSDTRSSGGLVQIVIHKAMGHEVTGVRDSLDSLMGPTFSECGSLDAYPRAIRTATPLDPVELGITSPTKVATLRLMRRAMKEREKLVGKVRQLEGQVREMAVEKRTVVAGIAKKEEEVHGLLEAQRKKERARFLEAKAKSKKLAEEYERRLDEKEEELFAVQRKMAEMEDALEETQARMGGQLETLQADLAMRSSTIDTLAKMVEDKEAEIAGLRAELATLRARVGQEGQRSNQELELAQRDLEVLQRQLEEERNRAQREMVLLERERASLEASIATVAEKLEEENKELRQRYTAEASERRKLYNQVLELKGNIRVFCRCRPLNAEELTAGEFASIAEFDSGRDGPTDVVIRTGNGVKKLFKFDRTFAPEEDQADVFADTAPVVTSVLDGYNVCIFAYGQTGTGKTFTMEGPPSNRGVNYRTLEELFRVAQERGSHTQYRISVSVLEVYNEQIRDLLVPPAPSGQQNKKLEIKQAPEGGHHVPGLVEAEVQRMEEVWEVLQSGSKNRSTGATNSNLHSSRSHCMLCVMVRGESQITGEVTRSKLWLVDLAGSERVAKSEVQGERLKEAQNINKSLSALGDVIAALTTKSPHVPYRNSKLTHLLQDSLGGDSKTLMFVQISPSQSDSSETLCSLAFASRVRGVELGPAKKQTDMGEVFKYKQLVERAKAEGRQKDEAVRRAEEGLRAAESKLKAREQQVAALTDKAQGASKAQHDLEVQLANERAARGAAEAALRELQRRLEEQPAAGGPTSRQKSEAAPTNRRALEGTELAGGAPGGGGGSLGAASGDEAGANGRGTAGGWAPREANADGAREGAAETSGGGREGGGDEGANGVGTTAGRRAANGRGDVATGGAGSGSGASTAVVPSGASGLVSSAITAVAAAGLLKRTTERAEGGGGAAAARSASESEKSQVEKRVMWSDEVENQQSEASVDSTVSGAISAVQSANQRTRPVASRYTAGVGGLAGTPQSKFQRRGLGATGSSGTLGSGSGLGLGLGLGASSSMGTASKGGFGVPLGGGGLSSGSRASIGGPTWAGQNPAVEERGLGQSGRRESWMVGGSVRQGALPAVLTGGATGGNAGGGGGAGGGEVPAGQSAGAPSVSLSAHNPFSNPNPNPNSSTTGWAAGVNPKAGTASTDWSDGSSFQAGVAGTPIGWRSGAGLGLTSRASLGLDRPPLSGMKQNRPPSDYLEKFEEFKKRKAEQGQETPGGGSHLSGIVPGTGVSLGLGSAGVPGSEVKKSAGSSRLGGRTGGAQRVKTKGGGASGRLLPPAPSRTSQSSRAWQ